MAVKSTEATEQVPAQTEVDPAADQPTAPDVIVKDRSKARQAWEKNKQMQQEELQLLMGKQESPDKSSPAKADGESVEDEKKDEDVKGVKQPPVSPQLTAAQRLAQMREQRQRKKEEDELTQLREERSRQQQQLAELQQLAKDPRAYLRYVKEKGVDIDQLGRALVEDSGLMDEEPEDLVQLKLKELEEWRQAQEQQAQAQAEAQQKFMEERQRLKEVEVANSFIQSRKDDLPMLTACGEEATQMVIKTYNEAEEAWLESGQGSKEDLMALVLESVDEALFEREKSRVPNIYQVMLKRDPTLFSDAVGQKNAGTEGDGATGMETLTSDVVPPDRGSSLGKPAQRIKRRFKIR